jgi:hypothetical protein
MPRLPIQLSNFAGPFNGIDGHYDLMPTWDDLVRAAVTVGYPSLASATMPSTFHRSWAVLFRASIVLAYLDAPTGDRIVRSPDYERADSSEKSSISYYLGLFGAKLGAEAVLRTPWLWHYDAYHRLARGVGPISRRPDLIGRTSAGEWIAVEAKGRTNSWTDKLRASAKFQAGTLSQVVHPGGASDPVAANIASITYFNTDGWCLLMDDPPSSARPLELTSGLGELYRAYYRPILAYVTGALEQQETETVEVGETGFKVAYDPDLDLFIGLANAIIESDGTSIDELRPVLSELRVGRDDLSRGRATAVEARDGTSWSLGEDGVMVRLGDRWRARENFR